MSRPQASSPRSRGRSGGFTLVEVLVALSILTTALVPAFVLASSAVRLSARIRNELIATNLAQEGVEVARAIRDANWFKGQPFDTGLSGCGAPGCAVQFNSDALPDPNGSPGDRLKLDPATGLYQYTDGADTFFRRAVTIEQGKTDKELVVSSRVDWDERGIPKHVTVEYHLFDWFQ